MPTIATLPLTQRFALLSILPEQVAAIREMKLVKRIRDKARLTEEQSKELNVTSDAQGNLHWDRTKVDDVAPPTEFDFTDAETEFIANVFVVMAQKGELPTSDVYVDLYSHFEEAIDAADAE